MLVEDERAHKVRMMVVLEDSLLELCGDPSLGVDVKWESDRHKARFDLMRQIARVYRMRSGHLLRVSVPHPAEEEEEKEEEREEGVNDMEREEREFLLRQAKRKSQQSHNNLYALGAEASGEANAAEDRKGGSEYHADLDTRPFPPVVASAGVTYGGPAVAAQAAYSLSLDGYVSD